jgi:NAD(P)H dehydrogenase (quinone)
MNILIVYCHPSERSYTFQILEQLKTTFKQQNWNVEISDLYAMNFRGDMTPQEYEREGFSKTELPISNDIVREHEKIENSDYLIFLYPVWWSDCPAKLKGWFDRVYTVGYAYKHQPDQPKMKLIKYGLVICTAGYTCEYLAETGIAQSMKTIMLEDRLGNRFETKEMLILGGTLEVEIVRQQHTRQIEEMTTKIKKYYDLTK